MSGSEIEVTDAMAAAGAQVLNQLDGPLMSEVMAAEVFRAMLRARDMIHYKVVVIKPPRSLKLAASANLQSLDAIVPLPGPSG